MRLNELPATDAVQKVAAGTATAEAVTQASLDRIVAREPIVHAWATLDTETALAQARARDQAVTKGPLHGLPIAVKDVLDTADLPTEMGSPIYRGHRPKADAACVALVRAAGAVILGKTVTAEFAGVAPGPTANPHNPTHTPGGSSSGSAAAVADQMVSVAFGTQTAGSIIRPASFCGIVGYKPTFNTFNRAGMKFAVESLDTVGLLARNVDDIRLVSDVLRGRTPPAQRPRLSASPRIGLCRTGLWDRAAPETREAVAAAAATFATAGATVIDYDLPAGIDQLNDARAIINVVERARAGAWEWAHHRDEISPQLRTWMEAGFATPEADYIEALRTAERGRVQFDDAWINCDVLLTPAAAGEAPEGLGSTGDSSFQGLWTLLHVPCVTLPGYRGPRSLPVGIQLVGRRYDDDTLLQIAAWAAACLTANKPA